MSYDGKGMMKDLEWMSRYLDEGLQEAYRNDRENKDPALAQGFRAIVAMRQAKCYTFNDILSLMLEHDAIDDDDLACLTVSTKEVKE